MVAVYVMFNVYFKKVPNYFPASLYERFPA